MNTHRQNAFTLFEILIALVIFAILGIIVAVGLRRTLESNQRANDADKRLQQLEITQALIRRDISAIVDRPITDRDGQTLPTVQIKPDVIEFTRGGLTNNLTNQPVSDLQRIEYRYSNGKIIRTLWPTLDRLTNSHATSMVLLANVSSFDIEAYDQDNVLHNSWPFVSHSEVITLNKTPPSSLPKAIQITFTINGQGTIQDIIPILSRGTPHQLSGSNNVTPTTPTS